jgi:hypothetical protein
MNEPERASWSRFLALDAHRQYLVAGGVDAHQTIVLKPVRVSFEEWSKWASANLHPTDALVLEATTNTWQVYDQVLPLVGRVVVAHPALVKLIASARVKTDPRDVLHLARLLAANLVPEVWVPPPAVRELRTLVNHRRHLVKHSTLTRNRLHSVLQRHNLAAPPGDPFSAKHRAWWHTLDLPAVEKLCLLQDLATLDHLTQQVGEVEAELMGFSVGEP